jgi:hypothetical protein
LIHEDFVDSHHQDRYEPSLIAFHLLVAVFRIRKKELLFSTAPLEQGFSSPSYLGISLCGLLRGPMNCTKKFIFKCEIVTGAVDWSSKQEFKENCKGIDCDQ